MLLVERDISGCLEAAMEVRVVDRLGQMAPAGTYLWIEQFEVSEGTEMKDVLARLIQQLDTLLPQIRQVYWVRRDKTGKRLHTYNRTRLVSWARKELERCYC